MRCGFCFAKFQDVKKSILPKGHLTREEAIEVVTQLAEFGFEKITFAGGEPTLCPWLTDLISTAKEYGMTTMVVTNGTGLTEMFLRENCSRLDWIALSIDSLKPEINAAIGRRRASSNSTQINYYELVDRIRSFGYGLKINTVVNAKNASDDMNEFIRYTRPKRWKLLQVLPVEGQNDGQFDEFRISIGTFERYVQRHNRLSELVAIVPESNEFMRGSYVMVDPAGRFFDNIDGGHRYSNQIHKIGVRLAIQEVRTDHEKFIRRGGIYNWVRPKFRKITLSGEVASGKSTVGRLLAEKLDYEFVSIGERTRRFAESQGLTIAEFQSQCLSNPQLDLQLDEEFSNECNGRENLIIDYRLGFYFVKRAYHVYLRISKQTAIERLKLAGRVNETHHTLEHRNACFKKQFEHSYGVDYTDTSKYDLVVNVEDFDTPEEIAEFIQKELRTGCPEQSSTEIKQS